jgi:hypothetical protein
MTAGPTNVVAGLVHRRVSPAPNVVSGRLSWRDDQVIQATVFCSLLLSSD